MQTPLRILRRRAIEIDPAIADLTPRQQLRERLILAVATDLFARFGPYAISFTNLARSMKMAPATMRWHFADLHALLGEIMRRHLQALRTAIEAVPSGAPDRRRLQRAAYVNATREGAGLTQVHHILTAYRTQLPDDERELVDALRDQLGLALGGAKGEAVLALLDFPQFGAEQIECMLQAAFRTSAPAEAPPAPGPQTAPTPETTPAPPKPRAPEPHIFAHAALSQAEAPRLRAPPERLAA